MASGRENLVRFTGVFVITGTSISGFLPLEITVILPGYKNISLKRGLRYVGVRYIGVTLHHQ